MDEESTDLAVTKTLEKGVDWLHPSPRAVREPAVLVVELTKAMLVFNTAVTVIGSSALSEEY